MARVTVTPESFSFVLFEHDALVALVASTADLVGFPADEELRLEVDERSPLGRTAVVSLEPVTISAESGALEDARHLRHLSERNVRDVIGRLLLRVLDRRSPGFADAPPDDALTLPQQLAWDTWAVGRCARVGLDVQEPRRRYHFRNRHGFTDVADEVFDGLWTADSLTWADVVAACEETRAAREPAPA
jgi:hypothetical protein